MLARLDFPRHCLETARQLAHFVAVLREVAQHSFLELARLNGRGSAGQPQKGTRETPRQRRDHQEQHQQTAQARQRRAHRQFPHGNEDLVFANIEHDLPAAQRRSRPIKPPAFALHQGRRESLGLCRHKLSAGPGGQIGAGKTFAEHQILLRMGDDFSRAADEIGEIVGIAAPAFGQVRRPHQFANPVQRQVHSRHPDEVGRRIEHRRGQADHADIAGPFVEVGFGNVERARKLRTVVPILLRVVVIVFHRGQGRPVFAVHRHAAAAVLRVHVFVGDVNTISLRHWSLAQQLAQIRHHPRVRIVSISLLPDGDVPGQHRGPHQEIIQPGRRGANLRHRLGVGLPLQFGPAHAVVEPHGQPQHQSGGHPDPYLQPACDAMV